MGMDWVGIVKDIALLVNWPKPLTGLGNLVGLPRVSNAFRGYHFFGNADPSPKSSVFGQVVPDGTALNAGSPALD